MTINRGALRMTTKLKNGKKRKMYKAGGDTGLKTVDKEKNPGLGKLSTAVRNKMGFMKKGGKVKAMKKGGKVKK